MGGTEEGYAAGGTDDAARPLLHRHREPASPARGRDRRGRAASALFPNVDPIGKWIDVDGHELEVIGVMERPPPPCPGQDDTRILIPYFTMRKMFPERARSTC